jgi:hypothetical protein
VDNYKYIFDLASQHIFVPSVQCHLKRIYLKPKAILFFDNCPAHPAADSLISKDGKIRAMYLPKNTTALIQPLDQGIIYSFKVNYRWELLLSLLSSERDVPEFLTLITLNDVAYKIGLAWESYFEGFYSKLEKRWFSKIG